MGKRLLGTWARDASWLMISEYVVPKVAAESEHARDLAKKWIKSRKESVASTGRSTYAGHVTVTPDNDLDFAEIKSLLKQIEKEIDSSANRVRFTMNGFVIAVGSYVLPLLKQAKGTAKKQGAVDVELGGTSCKVPHASSVMEKFEQAGKVGRKRKSLKC